MSTFTEKLKPVIMAGLVVGTLDGIAASLHTFAKIGRGPEVVFRFVASGVMGPDAFTGGTGMMWLGILFHYLVATGWSALYIALYPSLKKISDRTWINGPLYGIFVWLMMQYVVVPMTNVRAGKPTAEGVIIGLIIHMTVVGFAIAYTTRRYDQRIAA
jgi:hypothetical protein